MRLYLRNWRCVEELEMELAPLTLLVGKNAVGKSSVAYAPYFLMKAAQWGDPNRVLTFLYGVPLEGVVRTDGSARSYPLVVEVDGFKFSAKGPKDFELSGNPPWRGAYLLPSRRVGYFSMLQTTLKMLRSALSDVVKLASMLARRTPTPVPLLPDVSPIPHFVEDYLRLFMGKGLVEQLKVGHGVVTVEHLYLLSLVELSYRDEFVDLSMPLERAPDGVQDYTLIRLFLERAEEGSILVVEEPEIHKNPLYAIGLAEEMAEAAARRGLTVVATTHSDLVLQAVAKAVEKGTIRPSQAAVYYLERGPWTRARRLQVHEDGTIEALPDIEEAVVRLF